MFKTLLIPPNYAIIIMSKSWTTTSYRPERQITMFDVVIDCLTTCEQKFSVWSTWEEYNDTK